MGEAEILAQLQLSRYNVSVIAGQLIGVNFALVAAIYYFLHKTRLAPKLIAFGLYTAGYAALLILFGWENIHLDGLELALAQLVQSGEASIAAKTLFEGWSVGRTFLPDFLVGLLIVATWFAVGYLMFFYKFRTNE